MREKMYSRFDINHEIKKFSLLSEYTTKSYIADKAFSNPGYTVPAKEMVPFMTSNKKFDHSKDFCSAIVAKLTLFGVRKIRDQKRPW